MFADPQVITVATVAQSMARIMSSGTSAVYQKADETFKLTISHTKSKGRIRSMVRVDQRAIVADPLTAVNDYATLSEYYVIDRPEYGFTSTQVTDLAVGLKTWLDSTALGKVFGTES